MKNIFDYVDKKFLAGLLVVVVLAFAASGAVVSFKWGSFELKINQLKEQNLAQSKWIAHSAKKKQDVEQWLMEDKPEFSDGKTD